MSQEAFEVGTYTVSEDTVFEDRYETACNYRRFRVEAGEYAVYAYPRPGEYNPRDNTRAAVGSAGSGLYVRVRGAECVASYFESRILNHRSGELDADVGRRMDFSFRVGFTDEGVTLTDPRLILTPFEWVYEGVARTGHRAEWRWREE